MSLDIQSMRDGNSGVEYSNFEVEKENNHSLISSFNGDDEGVTGKPHSTPYNSYSYSHRQSRTHSQKLSSSSTTSSSSLSSNDSITRSSRSWSTDSQGSIDEIGDDKSSINTVHSLATVTGNPSKPRLSYQSHLSHSHSHSRLSISSNLSLKTTPPSQNANRKKRLSMNFAALPVVSSTAPSQNGTSSPTAFKENRRRTASVSLSTAFPNVSPQPVAITSTTMLSSDSPELKPKTSPMLKPTPAPASSMDLYLSQLAAKERKVVELKDEIKRAQADLKRAELELKLFREGASQALAPPKRSVEDREGLILSHRELHKRNSTITDTNVQSNITNSQYHKNTTNTDAQTHKHTTNDTQTHPNITTTSSSFPNSDHSPHITHDSIFDHPPSNSLPPPTRVPSNGQYGACIDPDRSPPTKPPHNQLPLIDFEPSSRPHFPPKDDVINMGKRVVEELGSQFWGLFEDIKNVTIGEEPREYSQNDNYNQQQQHPDQIQSSNSRRANSYYIL